MYCDVLTFGMIGPNRPKNIFVFKKNQGTSGIAVSAFPFPFVLPS